MSDCTHDCSSCGESCAQRESKPEDFLTALEELQKACGVHELKMSDFGIKKEEALTLAQNARATMGALFKADRTSLSDEDCATIFEKAYR